MGSRKTGSGRRRVWRLGTVLPAVLTAVTGLTAGGVIRSPLPNEAPAAAAASFSDGAPIGALDRLGAKPGGVRAVGWAFDPNDKTAPARINIRIDGAYVAGADADLPRDDVAADYPRAGANHGFAFFVPVPEGEHAICVRVRNVEAGANSVLGCVTRTFDYGPQGALDSLTTAPGHLVVRGWVFDWDDPTAPVSVHVVIDGVATNLSADKFRADVAKARPAAGGNHGFAATLPLKQGTHTVCVNTVNIGYGSNNTFGCRSITLNDNPLGALQNAAQSAGALKITGWALDNDKPTTALTVTATVDGIPHILTANAPRPDIATQYPGAGPNHGFVATYKLAEGSHQVCVTVQNIGYGGNAKLPCQTRVLNFTPAAALTDVTATSTGLHVRGWAADPDTTQPISVALRVDGRLARTQAANQDGLGHDGHAFAADMPVRSGTHKICAIGLNALYGTHDSAASCRTITLALKPLGAFEGLARVPGSSDLRLKGWALDPDTHNPITLRVMLDDTNVGTVTANALRADIGDKYPYGDDHGLWARVKTDDGEHTVCLTALNVGGGGDVQLGCKLIIAVNPVAPSAPRNVAAIAGFGGAEVTWTKPSSDGGAPWTRYVVVSNPDAVKVTVAGDATSATVLGLKPSTNYTFTVRAVNVAGASAAATTATVKTQASPPPQTTPAPVSTSRYIRNIHGSSATDLATMRSEGATDASFNPSGHGYLVLLDIGGQDEFDDGVVLSAGVRFVTYTDLVACLKAYVDGYHSKQKLSAPVTIAIGTNNDMDVSRSSGQTWARRVVQPIVDYVKGRYAGITIAGANDIEPGFRASYSQTKDWLGGYLANTAAPFVFNGSADGCSWTASGQGCNNGWRMNGLYWLAAGAAPVRMLNLPQIYNTTMASQWKYISLTGITAGRPRINFGGPLTEWTACAQAQSCGSLTGKSAWTSL
ncbi:MAG: hypothetical protein QOI15_2952, partial [Pseudonocardiales bacterium]|nr:hypothetical protein [Pseudonocardiales bacterium]